MVDAVANGTPRFSGPIVGIVVSAGLSAAGYILESTLLLLAGLVVAVVILIVLFGRHGRTYRPFFRRWQTLSEAARERLRDQYTSLTIRRNAGLLFVVIAIALVVSSGPLLVRSEAMRGADLNNPGLVFVTYNRFAAPDLAELIHLFVVRDLPLDQADASDLRVLRNLYFAVEGYDFDSQDLRDIFGGLIWYHPYRAFPNDINALPYAYRQKVEQIISIERSRG